MTTPIKTSAWLALFLLMASLPALAGPIHDAAAAGDAAKVTSLLDKDPALLNARGDKGFTPLLSALDQRRLDVAALLIGRGADVGTVSDEGLTPLMDAAGQDMAMVQALLDKGADVKAADKDGWTALHFAATMGQTAVVRLLLAHGADAAAKEYKGRTPRDLALVGKHPDTAELLAPPASPADPAPASAAPVGGDHAAQIAAETAAIEKEPGRADLYLQRGRTHARLTKTGIFGLPMHPEADAARADFDKAIALDPALAEAYAERALLHDDIDLTKTGPDSELALTLADADKAVTLAPNNAVVYLDRGTLRQNAVEATNLNHMFEQATNKPLTLAAERLAQADLDKALALDPKVPGGYRERARIRGWIGDDPAGEQADLEQAVAQDPRDTDSLVSLVNAASRRSDWPAARKAVDALIALRPDAGELYTSRAQIRAQQSDPDGALIDANKAVDLGGAKGGPPLAAALLVRGGLLTAQKKYDLAEADERKATETDPDNLSAWNSLALLQGDANRIDDAAATLRKGLTTHPQSSVLHLTLGLILALKDDVPGLQAEYAAGLPTSAPDDIAAQTALVQSLLKARPDSAGLKAALAALQAAPGKH